MPDAPRIIKYGVVHKHLPDLHTGEVKYSMDRKLFDTPGEAQEHAKLALLQNLPYRSKVIYVNMPDNF
jgi:hypothetical protein